MDFSLDQKKIILNNRNKLKFLYGTTFRDFFESKIGACSFDFIKVSLDRQKLFVAVRFEKKNEAKECYERYFF